MPTEGSEPRALVVIGASAGGVEALRTVAADLPGDLAVAIVVVLHIPAAGDSQLPAILSRAGPLPAVHAVNGMELELGRIHVAPADHHLLVRGATLALTRGPRINGHRPAIDPMFRSAAAWFGPGVTAVLLSGMLDDGAAGMVRLHQAGALTLVQDPGEASHPNLPRAAIELGAVDHVLTARAIAKTIVEQAPTAPTDLRAIASTIAREDEMSDTSLSPFTCPNCHGTLWEVEEPTGLQFRCRTGHTFSAESLAEVTVEALDDALWGAYRSLLEQADLSRRMAKRMRDIGNERSIQRHEQLALDAERRARVIYDVIAEPSVEGTLEN